MCLKVIGARNTERMLSSGTSNYAAATRNTPQEHFQYPYHPGVAVSRRITCVSGYSPLPGWLGYTARSSNSDSDRVMRLILSRKGFDSSAGGCPSPIFPDGSLYALPIPDEKSAIRYCQLRYAGHSVGKLVEDLTRGKVSAAQGAHLDPDMHPDALPRLAGWRPLLGQTGAAQGHLRKQGIEVGDLFLFFGLFRPVELEAGQWRFVRDAPARHIIWGWLSIGEICKVDALTDKDLHWARYHPHFRIGTDAGNTLYIAGNQASLPHSPGSLPGAGFFPSVQRQLVLTDPEAMRPTLWQLPRCFYPGGSRNPLSYHSNMARWELRDDSDEYCQLQCVARGQEFVLNLDDYPDVSRWLTGLITEFGLAVGATD